MSVVADSIRVAQAVVRVLGDSTKTHEIHRVEEITGRPRYRRLLRELAGTAEGRRLLAERPELSSEHVDYDALRALPATTFGNTYVRHLDGNHITADYQAAATRHVDDPDIAYLMRRFRQTHDVWHALLGLGITGHEEVVIHWFSYGQLQLPVSGLYADRLATCTSCLACEAACPPQAIVFGNINDPASRVAKLKAEPLDYGLLEDLNTRPRTTYLAAVRNPNPEMPDAGQEARATNHFDGRAGVPAGQAEK
jgi:ubiquinone biosynthesis protein Coq4